LYQRTAFATGRSADDDVAGEAPARVRPGKACIGPPRVVVPHGVVVVMDRPLLAPEEEGVGADTRIDIAELTDLAFDESGQGADDGDVAAAFEHRGVFEAVAAGQKTPLVGVTGVRPGAIVERAGKNLDAGFGL